MPVDTFAKAAGWYGLMFGDLSHALDIRLMMDDRVAIFDASYSFYPSVSSSNRSPVKVEENDASGESSCQSPHTLKPIPNYPDIVFDCVREALDSGSAVPDKIAPFCFVTLHVRRDLSRNYLYVFLCT